MGCLRRLGCLVLLLAMVAAAYLYRDRLAALYHRLRGIPEPAPIVFTPPAPGAAAKAEGALDRLARRGGPAYVDLDAAQLAGLISSQLAPGPHPALDSIAVALGTDRVEVRGSLDVSVLPRKLLGPLAAALGAREPVTAGGRLSVADGQVWWTIDALKLHDFAFPRPVIPALLGSMGLPGLRGAAIPLPLATGVGDLRVSPAGVRVYRASPR
jgi:hypothetical protein